MTKNKFIAAVFFITALALFSCKKQNTYNNTIPPSQVHFIGDRFQTYSAAAAPVPVYEVIIGTTDVVTQDRLVNFEISSPTGAVAGDEYEVIGGNSVTIRAGESRAVIKIQADFDAYTTGRIDTLNITLKQPAVVPASFNDKVSVIIVSCNEGNVVVADLLGNYNNTSFEFAGTAGVPYQSIVTNTTLTSSTTALVTIANVLNNWAPVNFIFNWSDPANRTVTAVAQGYIAGSSAADLGGPPAPLGVQNFPGMNGTFSICNNTIQLKLQVGLSDGTTVNNWVPVPLLVNMVR